MPVNLSKYAADAYLNWEKGTTMPAAPSNLYLALLTTMPTDNSGTGLVEVSGTGYARQQITPAQWAAVATSGSFTETSSTNVTVTFPAAGSNWGTIVGVALYDASSAGNALRFGTLSTGNQSINTGNIFSVPSGSLARTVN